MGVQVGRFELDYSSFDDVIASRPIPTFFSDKPEETLAQLQKSPEFAFQCLQALVSKLFERGELSRYSMWNFSKFLLFWFHLFSVRYQLSRI